MAKAWFCFPQHSAKEPFSLRRAVKQLLDGFRLSARTLALVWASSPVSTVILGVLTVASAALPLAVAYAGKGIVDSVVIHSMQLTMRWVLIELGIVVTQAVVLRALGLVRQLLGARLALDI